MATQSHCHLHHQWAHTLLLFSVLVACLICLASALCDSSHRARPHEHTFHLDGIWCNFHTIRNLLWARNWTELTVASAEEWESGEPDRIAQSDVVKQRPVSRYSAMNADLIWTWSYDRAKNAQSIPCQIVNQFPNAQQVCKKGSLLVNLKKTYQGRINELFSFIPRAYYLDDPSEMQHFVADFVASEDQSKQVKQQQQQQIHTTAGIETNLHGDQQPIYRGSPDVFNAGHNIWILKPGNMDRGVGIALFDKLSDILQLFNNSRNRTDQGADLIAQKYIELPLLIRGHKFDIRQFVLVRSLNPLEVYLFDDCYLRMSAFPYSANFSNLFIHLTNHQVQKQAHISKQELDETTVSCAEFQQILSQQTGDDQAFKKIRERIKHILVQSLKAWSIEGHRDNSFQLIGMDILIDEGLNPWLLELNMNPGLYLTTPVVSAHHKHLLDSLVKTILDDDISSGFELVHRGIKQELSPEEQTRNTVLTKPKKKFEITKLN